MLLFRVWLPSLILFTSVSGTAAAGWQSWANLAGADWCPSDGGAQAALAGCLAAHPYCRFSTGSGISGGFCPPDKTYPVYVEYESADPCATFNQVWNENTQSCVNKPCFGFITVSPSQKDCPNKHACTVLVEELYDASRGGGGSCLSPYPLPTYEPIAHIQCTLWQRGADAVPGNLYDSNVNMGRYAYHSCGEQPETSNEPPKSCGVGNPVNSANGNKYQVETDLQGSATSGIGITRYYNSDRHGALYGKSPYGHNWTNQYSPEITVTTEWVGLFAYTRARVLRPTGRIFTFTDWNCPGCETWQPEPGVYDSLREIRDTTGAQTGWEYTTVGNTVERFNLNGVLQTITDIHGNTQTLSYDTLGLLERVDDDAGKSLRFSYDAMDRISATTTGDGRVWGYRYDADGNLEYVDNPDGTIRQYHYNETAHTANGYLPHALTGITDERGVRFSTYRYDGRGRAISSYRAMMSLTDHMPVTPGVLILSTMTLMVHAR